MATPVAGSPAAPGVAIARGWLALAIASLVLAGAFALALVVGRMPPFDRLVTDPGFFRRCLVVHVDLSLVVWFHAFLAALHARLGLARPALAGAGLAAATLGVAALTISAGLPGTTPVLANYVPAIDHPWWLAGVALFAGGVAASIVAAGPGPARGLLGDVPAAAVAMRAAGLAFLVAAATFVVSVARLPPGLPAAARYELGAWGGGHVLQFASVAAMLAAWLLLASSLAGRPVLGRGAAIVSFAILLAPLAAAPVLALMGPITWQYRVGFTRMMQWGIFPVVLAILAACVAGVASGRRRGHWTRLADVRVIGLAASGSLTVVGFLLGAAISGSSTLVPAHYHASIGAVTAAFMAATWLLLPQAARVRARLPPLRRWITWQPAIFGAGQVVFALGFALAGAHGTARKAFGVEQAGRSLPETVGLVIMGLGGLVAVAGGLLYLGLLAGAWLPRSRRLPAPRRAMTCNEIRIASTPWRG